MKIKSRKYDVMATSEGAANNHPSEIPSALPPDKAGESRQDGPGAANSHDGTQNGGGAGPGSQNGDGALNGGGEGAGAEKKAKRSMKKVSFGFDDVQEIPAREDAVEEESGDTIEEAVETDLTDEEEEDEEGEKVKNFKNLHKDSDIEFLRKFANLRKLGNVMEERSRKQEAAVREQADSQLARAREILQKRVRRQELARLIPSEELERLLNAVNMQEEFVVSRDDTRKFVITNRGKTSYIFLAGKDGAEEEEEAPVLLTQSDDTFSQTFGDGAALL
jgi:hypothetical protein